MFCFKQLLTTSILLSGLLFTTHSGYSMATYGYAMASNDQFDFNEPKLDTPQNQINTLRSFAYALERLSNPKLTAPQERIENVYRNAYATVLFIESKLEDSQNKAEETLKVVQQLILCNQANSNTWDTALNLVQKYRKRQKYSIKKEILIILQNLIKRQFTSKICELAQTIAQEYLANCKDVMVQEEANKLLEQIGFQYLD